MGYTVFCLTDEEGHQGSGMTLAEAFTRMMALAHCDYAFGRSDGVMGLTITHLDDVPEEYLADPELREHFRPDYRSKLQNDNDARVDLMRRFLWRGMKGYQIVTDEYYRCEESKWNTARAMEMDRAPLRDHERVPSQKAGRILSLVR